MDGIVPDLGPGSACGVFMSISVSGRRAGTVFCGGLSAFALLTGLSGPSFAFQDVIRTTQPPVSDTPAPGLVDDAPPVQLDPQDPQVPQPTLPRPFREPAAVLPTQRVYLGEDERIADLGPPNTATTRAVFIPALSLAPQIHTLMPWQPIRLDLTSRGLCRGYFDPVPALTLEVEVGRRVSITTQENVDTVLLARLPDGHWACDDDGGLDLNARLDLQINSWDGPVSVYVGYYDNLLLHPPIQVEIDPNPRP